MNLTFEKHLSFNFKEFNAITNNEDRAKFLINLGIYKSLLIRHQIKCRS